MKFLMSAMLAFTAIANAQKNIDNDYLCSAKLTQQWEPRFGKIVRAIGEVKPFILKTVTTTTTANTITWVFSWRDFAVTAESDIKNLSETQLSRTNVIVSMAINETSASEIPVLKVYLMYTPPGLDKEIGAIDNDIGKSWIQQNLSTEPILLLGEDPEKDGLLHLKVDCSLKSINH